MNHESYEPNNMLSVFLALGFERLPKVDNEYIYYLYHRGINKEIFVEKIDDVDSEFLEDQLNDIGLNKNLFDSLYENLNIKPHNQ